MWFVYIMCACGAVAVHKYRATSGAGGEGVWQRVRIGFHSTRLEGSTESLGWALPLLQTEYNFKLKT